MVIPLIEDIVFLVRQAHFSKVLTIALLWSQVSNAADRLSILDYHAPGEQVDRTGSADSSNALALAITAANVFTSKGEPACVYIPPGRYRIVTPPPAFNRAGCVLGDGPTQSILEIDKAFSGDLFQWSESWVVTTPGPTAIGLTIKGSRSATEPQNAFVFYDRNDEVFMDNINVIDLHGRAIYSGVTKFAPSAYMREAHLRSLRLFRVGTIDLPVIEFSSTGSGDATNEIRMSQIDIYGSHGPSFVIRNDGKGTVRNITVEALRIEGLEQGGVAADLLTIGDRNMRGNVNNVTLTNVELIDPYDGFAAIRLTAPPGVAAPYQISVSGFIGGGSPAGEGLRIDAGRTSIFRLTGLNTRSKNVIIGKGVSGIIIDGGGQESKWSYDIDPTSVAGISAPLLRSGDPSKLRQDR